MTILEQMGNAWRIRDLRRKLLVTLGLLGLCRVGVYVPLPGINVKALGDLFGRGGFAGMGILGVLNLFTGGALSQGAVFGLGIMPYITASIIFTLLGSVIPSLEALRKEGAAGQRKLNQYMRIATVFVCFLQGTVVLRTLVAQLGGAGMLAPVVTGSWFGAFRFMLTGVVLLTAGTMFLMWIGEQIDQHGIGNGISLIITVSILDRFPGALYQMQQSIRNAESQQNAVLKVVLLMVLFVAVIVAIVYITQGERRIPVQQQKHVRGPKVYGGQKHYLPLRVNTAGVMPIIFASVLLQFPWMIAGYAASHADVGSRWHALWQAMSNAFGRQSSLPYVLLYGMLIFFFCYFWTAVVFNPREMSESLQSYGSFIPGIRPGRRTANYLEGIMNRITLAGAFFLLAIALLPTFIMAGLGVGRIVAGLMGGTSILIVVGVTLETWRRVNDHLEMRRYSGFAAGVGGRRRSRRR
jgi:preprotein translocase subunit SecY